MKPSAALICAAAIIASVAAAYPLARHEVGCEVCEASNKGSVMSLEASMSPDASMSPEFAKRSFSHEPPKKKPAMPASRHRRREKRHRHSSSSSTTPPSDPSSDPHHRRPRSTSSSSSSSKSPPPRPRPTRRRHHTHRRHHKKLSSSSSTASFSSTTHSSFVPRKQHAGKHRRRILRVTVEKSLSSETMQAVRGRSRRLADKRSHRLQPRGSKTRVKRYKRPVIVESRTSSSSSSSSSLVEPRRGTHTKMAKHRHPKRVHKHHHHHHSKKQRAKVHTKTTPLRKKHHHHVKKHRDGTLEYVETWSDDSPLRATLRTKTNTNTNTSRRDPSTLPRLFRPRPPPPASSFGHISGMHRPRRRKSVSSSSSSSKTKPQFDSSRTGSHRSHSHSFSASSRSVSIEFSSTCDEVIGGVGPFVGRFTRDHESDDPSPIGHHGSLRTKKAQFPKTSKLKLRSSIQPRRFHHRRRFVKHAHRSSQSANSSFSFEKNLPHGVLSPITGPLNAPPPSSVPDRHADPDVHLPESMARHVSERIQPAETAENHPLSC